MSACELDWSWLSTFVAFFFGGKGGLTAFLGSNRLMASHRMLVEGRVAWSRALLVC